MPNISIAHADCIEFLKSLADNSIGHINADPPYNIGYDGGGGWDTFAGETEYLDWCQEWLSECARVLRPERMMCVWGTQKTDTFFRLKLEVLNHLPGITAQNAIHWSYNWGGRPRNNFAHKFESAWCYSKGERFYFDRSRVEIERKMKVNIRTGKPYENGTVPTTIWEGNLGTTSAEARESKFHPTVKPQFVLQRMISGYTPAGETVLDPFSGSGSTAIAAYHTGHDFLGCERDAHYHAQSLLRLRRHQALPEEFFE